MSRAERRRRQREARRNPIYNYAPKQIERANRERMELVADEVIAQMFIMPMYILYRDYGFRRKRLERFGEQLTDLYTDFTNGDMELGAFAEYLADEIGMEFRRNK